MEHHNTINVEDTYYIHFILHNLLFSLLFMFTDIVVTENVFRHQFIQPSDLRSYTAIKLYKELHNPSSRERQYKDDKRFGLFYSSIYLATPGYRRSISANCVTKVLQIHNRVQLSRRSRLEFLNMLAAFNSER